MQMLFCHFHTPLLFSCKADGDSSRFFLPPSFSRRNQHTLASLLCCAECSKLTSMAPRGRPRKRSTRMDAAIDAMRNLGFDGGVVIRTVKELLDIYGDDGWPFIEEYGYKELIDAILRSSETAKDENLEKSDCTQNEVADASAEDVAGSSNTGSGQICPEVGDFAPGAENTIVKSPSSSACNTVKNTDNIGGTPLANEDMNGKIGEQQITSTQKERCNDICNSRGKPVAAIKSQSACAVSAPLVPSRQPPSIQKDKSHDLCNASASAVRVSPLTLSQTPVSQPVARRRFPCYGWIDSDDEQEDVDLVYSVPVDHAKRPAPFAKNNRGTKKVKHQSKWDVRPENL